MTYSLLESFRSHVKAGRLSEALSRFMDLPKVRSRDESKEREVVHAELLQLTGSNEEARDVANGLLRTAVSEALQARCQLVLGQVCLEKEAPSHSVRYFQKAARLAHDAQEMQLVCHAQAKLLAVLADISPRNSILGLMREAEQNVANYGTAQVNADFYTRVAQIEATAGSFACAVKHIDTAETFLEVDPNLWLEGSTCLAASAVYFLASDLDVATQYATSRLLKNLSNRTVL